MSDHSPPKEEHEGSGHIIQSQSLVVNVLIAAVKAIAAVFTKSRSMLVEALRSFSDCTISSCSSWAYGLSTPQP